MREHAIVYGPTAPTRDLPDDRRGSPRTAATDTDARRPAGRRRPGTRRRHRSGVAASRAAAEAPERVLFPTATFAIFFMVVLPLSWLLRQRGERWRPFIIAASFVFYAGWDWRFCFLLAFSIAWNQVLAVAIHAPARRRGPKRLLAVALVGNLGAARLLQVLRLLRHVDEQPLRTRRRRPPARGSVDPAAGRHLLLHVHGDQLRRRRLPRRLRARRLRDVRRVPLVLPASRRRADRAAGRAHPADVRSPRDPRYVDTSRAFFLIGTGPLHEGGDREPPRGEHRRRGLRRPEPALVARGARRDLRVRGPDLRRLLRLHEHRHRDRAPARLHLPAELRRARTRRRRSRTSGAAGT